MKISKINGLISFSVIVISFVSGMYIGAMKSNDIQSFILKEENAETDYAEWGHIVIYTSETSTTTYGTENMLTAMAELKPGQEIHPPHQHTAEEFMYIMEGNGTWSLNGKESEANAGDLLYAQPWDMHGITNTGSIPLRFFVIKWDNKGLELPVLDEK